MLADVVGCLRCPHCHADLALIGDSLLCANGHSFDVARQGYVNLLPGDARPGTADTPDMVEARGRFLESGHYDFIAAALADAARRALAGAGPGCAVELGAGTGFYLSRVLAAVPERAGLALDISKHALRRAARAHQRLGAVVCDVWRPLPVRSAVAALVLSVFAPRNPAEMRRILDNRGTLVVVTPAARHLHQLVAALSLVEVEEQKQERLQASLAPFFDRVERMEYEEELLLDDAEAAALAAMGPSAHHADPLSLSDRIQRLPRPIRVTAAVGVAVYRPRAG